MVCVRSSLRLVTLGVLAVLGGCGSKSDSAEPAFDEGAVRDAVEEIYPDSPDPDQLVALARHDCEDTDEQFRFTVKLMVAVGSDLSLLAAGCPDRLRSTLADIEAEP